MPRGGRRPGAGAPRGNLNAYKHGRTSQTHHRLLDLISRDPEAFALMLKLAEGNRGAEQRRWKKAQRLMLQIIEHLEQQRTTAETRLYEINRSIPPPPGIDPYSQ